CSGAVLLGDGTGHFSLRHHFNVYDCNIQYLATADFNGDGMLDVLVSGSYEAFSGFEILLGNGDGTFQPISPQYPSGGGRTAIADFNGDGILDVATPDYDAIDVYLGRGDGSFNTAATYSSSIGPGLGVVATDVNHDGKLDLVTNAAGILLGNADG